MFAPNSLFCKITSYASVPPLVAQKALLLLFLLPLSTAINSETGMNLELKAPLKPPLGFSESFPYPYTSWALFWWRGQGTGLCCITLLPVCAASFACRHTPLLPGHLGPPISYIHLCSSACAPSFPDMLSPEAAGQEHVLGMLLSCTACRGLP